MPWHIEQDDNGQYCVIKDDDSTNEGCHDTRAEAEDQVAALYANSGETPPSDGAADLADATGTAFSLFIVVEGVETTDGRMFELGALSPRDVLPVPLMFQNRAEHGGFGGDTTAQFVGAIEDVHRDERDESRWLGSGHMLDTEFARDAEAQMRGGLRGVSIDATADSVVYDIRSVSEDGWPVDVLARFDKGTIMGATVTPHPAFEFCTIWFADESEPEWVAGAHGTDIPMTEDPEVVEDEAPLLLLASGGGPVAPPAAWFDRPGLDGPTALSVSADGRVAGHLAVWSQCHIGQPDTCVTAPTSPSGYAYFHTGEIRTADDELVAVGQITLGTGHARLTDDYRGAVAHYDDTGLAVADVRVGEDDDGIWCAGAVRPGITDAQIRALCAASPSGDWRRINGNLELVAVLAVNVPGFPVPRTNARVASGVETALVAAPGPGVMAWPAQQASARPSRIAALEAQVARLERAFQPLLVEAHEKAVARATATIRAREQTRAEQEQAARRSNVVGRKISDLLY